MADKSENRSMVQGRVKREIEEIRRSGQQKSASRESEYDGTMQQFAVGAMEGPIQDCFFYDQTGV